MPCFIHDSIAEGKIHAVAYPAICVTSVLHTCLIHSFIPSGYFYSACSNPLLLRGAPDSARILCRSFTPKRHRQLRVKDLPNVPTWPLERDSNPRPFGQKATNLAMGHHVPRSLVSGDYCPSDQTEG